MDPEPELLGKRDIFQAEAGLNGGETGYDGVVLQVSCFHWWRCGVVVFWG
jgi:hypothetical protein